MLSSTLDAPNLVGVPASELLWLLRRHGDALARSTRRPICARADRWYRRIYLDTDHELWVIQWPRGAELDLHDHGGSSGAFLVLEGALTEAVVSGHLGVRRRRVGAGEGSAFGPAFVHGVSNADLSTSFSIHAYSPPLAGMTYYEASADGLERVGENLASTGAMP